MAVNVFAMHVESESIGIGHPKTVVRESLARTTVVFLSKNFDAKKT